MADLESAQSHLARQTETLIKGVEVGGGLHVFIHSGQKVSLLFTVK